MHTIKNGGRGFQVKRMDWTRASTITPSPSDSERIFLKGLNPQGPEWRKRRQQQFHLQSLKVVDYQEVNDLAHQRKWTPKWQWEQSMTQSNLEQSLFKGSEIGGIHLKVEGREGAAKTRGRTVSLRALPYPISHYLFFFSAQRLPLLWPWQMVVRLLLEKSPHELSALNGSKCLWMRGLFQQHLTEVIILSLETFLRLTSR